MGREHEDALELQGELHRWWAGPQGHAFARMTAEWSGRFLGAVDEKMAATADTEAAKLRVADPYWIHPDMVRLTERAAVKMDPETLEPTDLPTPTGFAVLGDPILFQRVEDDDRDLPPGMPAPPKGELPIVAFSWGPLETGIHLLFYTWTELLRSGDPRMAKLMILNQHPWEFGTDAPKDDYEPVHRFCKAFWALCQQRIGQAETTTVDRSTQRRAQRAGLESLVGVRVVTLRRRVSQPAEGERAVDWSCRWVVEGHWRNQWYPSAGVHRQKWIDEYVKGPEDAPLRMKDRVFRVDR